MNAADDHDVRYLLKNPGACTALLERVEAQLAANPDPELAWAYRDLSWFVASADQSRVWDWTAAAPLRDATEAW